MASNTTTETIDYRTLVAMAEGADYPDYEHDAYEFSKKTFEEDAKSGVYNNNAN